MDKELLKLLRCPETRQSLEYVQELIIDAINVTIAQGTLKNRGGQAVQGPIAAGLLRDDRKFLYPVRHGVPIMLIDESIPFAEFKS